jgi:ribosomal protein L32
VATPRRPTSRNRRGARRWNIPMRPGNWSTEARNVCG